LRIDAATITRLLFHLAPSDLITVNSAAKRVDQAAANLRA
jgi:hypothetical protein